MVLTIPTVWPMTGLVQTIVYIKLLVAEAYESLAMKSLSFSSEWSGSWRKGQQSINQLNLVHVESLQNTVTNWSPYIYMCVYDIGGSNIRFFFQILL